jgi:hypothetical protein
MRNQEFSFNIAATNHMAANSHESSGASYSFVKKIGTLFVTLGLLLLIVSCAPDPIPGEQATPAPPPALELVEVRTGPGDGTPVTRNQLVDEFTVLPQAAIKIVVKQTPITFGRFVTIDGIAIPRVAADQMHGDDAKFTVIPLWKKFTVISMGEVVDEEQEMIIVQPNATERAGSGFLIQLSTTSSNMTSQPLSIIVGPEWKMPSCTSFFPVGSPPAPTPKLLSSNFAAQVHTRTRLSDPSSNMTKIAMYLTNDSVVVLEIQESPTIPSNHALIHFENETSGKKILTAMNGTDCRANGQLIAEAGESMVAELIITDADTTTLAFSREVCVLFACNDEFIGVWTESAFWKLFGGKWVKFTWKE